MSRIQKGFTLIELLVVVAIIALLAAILFPAFGVVREKARQSSCASNMKQIGLGIMQYQQDADERMPNGTWPNTAYANYGAGWAEQVMPYVKNYDLFVCPDDVPGAYISYIGNANVFSPQEISGHSNAPAQTVVLSEISNFTVYNLQSTYDYGQCPTWNGLNYSFHNNVYNNQWGVGGWQEQTGWMAGYPGEGENQFGRHSGGSNYLLLDGHVKWMLGTSVSPGGNASTAKSAEVIEDFTNINSFGYAAGTSVYGYEATFSTV